MSNSNQNKEDLPTSAILVGNTPMITKDDIAICFANTKFKKIGSTFFNSELCFRIYFDSNGDLNQALSRYSTITINGYPFSLKMYKPKRPEKTFCALNHFLTPNPPPGSDLFTFIHNSKRYSVNPILAATFSRKIRTLLKEDPTIREFSVYPKQGDFECIAQIFTTARIQFSDRLHYDPEFMYIIASQLQIDFLLPQLEDDYIDTLDPQKALEGLNLTNQFGAGIDIHIKYIASHIYKFETQALEQEIKDLDPNLKDMIFTSSYLPGGYGLGNNNIVENSEKKLSQMSQEEYCEFVSDPTVDLNKERAMFIELLDSNIRN